MPQEQDINLNPIITPDPIPFTMDTIGWKVLFILLILALLFTAYRFYKTYKQNAYRRAAIYQIENLIAPNKNDTCGIISQIMFLLKQTALHTYDRKQVASLEGENWLLFLDSKLNQSVFIKHKDIIASAIYKNEYNRTKTFNIKEFANHSINWIKRHA